MKKNSLVMLNHKMTGLLIALSQSVDSSGRIQIFPDGKFYAKDNRFPKGWELTKESAEKLIETANSRKDDYMIDYEHQAILSEKNGKPVVAAGWFKNLEYIEGQGLFAEVKWTEKASEMIKADEYRYISPTFQTDGTGAILSLFNVALTNTPAIDGMANVIALSENTGGESFDIDADLTRDSFKDAVRKLSTLFENMSDDQIIGAITEMIYQVQYLKENPAGNPDPSKFVPLSALTEVQSQLSNALARENKRAVDELIEKGKADGKIVPATEKWARDYAAKDLVGAKEYLSNVAKIIALGETQTGGVDPIDGGIVALSESEKTAAFEMGLSHEDYAKRKKSLKY